MSISHDTEGTVGYRALTEGVALFETERRVFDIHGPQARRIVNGLVTNDLGGLDEGRGVYAFALTAKGRPLAEMRVLPAPGLASPGGEGSAGAEDAGDEPPDERVWIDVPAEAAEAFADLLARSVPPIFARHSAADVRRLSIGGPGAREAVPAILHEAGFGEVEAPGSLEALTIRRGEGPGGLLVGREPIEGSGADIYLPSEEARDAWSALERAVAARGGAVAEADDLDIVRVERGFPRYGAEITEGNLPQETGQTDRAVSFSKGCYTGQEVVARIHYRGHVNRTLRGARPLDSAEPGFVAGSTLYAGGRRVGELVTVVDSHRFGPIALAYVRTSVEPGGGVALEAEGPDAVRIEELPFTSR